MSVLSEKGKLLFVSEELPHVGRCGFKLGDMYIPLAHADVGPIYRCESVNYPVHTWNGFRAFRTSENTFDFESELTSNLPYTTICPVPGKIYSADALNEVAYLNTAAQA